MKQIIQDIRNGETILIETPVPSEQKGHVLIKSHYSLVSKGTEKMLLEFGKAGWIEKARQQPEKVQQVISKIKSDGLAPTIQSVLQKLDSPIPLGYCNAGEVIAVGPGVTEFKIGDRVVSNGPHSEYVSVGKNLVALIPEGIDYEEAVFTVIGSIALQGIRLISPGIGDVVVVQGLGLIGMLAVQLLKMNGCQVIGIDTDYNKVELAKKYGVQTFLSSSESNVVSQIMHLTGNHGADAVLITASTQSDELIAQSAQSCRKRGKIVLIGTVGLDINRSDFYEKELSFQVSCSYGPGRYDEQYEKSGIDYPYAYVRWTEKRNFEAVLQSMANQSLKVKDLISEVVELDHYQKIYQNLNSSQSIASLIKYNTQSTIERRIQIFEKSFKNASTLLGVIGAGNFTTSTMMPLLYKLNAPIKTIASNSGLSATQLSKKYNIPVVCSQYKDVMEDSSIGGVLITTRHQSHATLVVEALKNNKHILVEKPLATSKPQLDQIIEALKDSKGSILVGFNRRHSPAARNLRNFIQKSTAPIQLILTMNAGYIPSEHWTQNTESEGGRIIGEACHFFDLANYLTGSLVEEVMAQSISQKNHSSDHASILLKYKNGSCAVINYFSNGNKSYPKERIEMYQNGVVAIIDNFKKLSFYGGDGKAWSGTQDKGHKEQYQKWLKFIESGGDVLIEPNDLINTTLATFAAVDSIMSGNKIIISS